MTKVKEIEFPTYRVPDLDLLERFLLDFGMKRAKRTDTKLWMRGYGTSPYLYVAELGEKAEFVSLAMSVGSEEDLHEAAKSSNGSSVQDLDGPGGGKFVSLFMPDGFRIDLVHGIERTAAMDLPDSPVLNSVRGSPRVGKLQRLPLGPTPVVRLGHGGFNVSNVIESAEWWVRNCGMIVTDWVLGPDQKTKIAAFLRCDQGDDWVEHHTIYVGSGDSCHVHHCAYEVADPDTVQMGNEWLMRQGYLPEWGTGRHLLGSQVFDYWRDPFGHMIEHMTDSDMLNAEAETLLIEWTPDNMSQWGPRAPRTFFS